jgi:hypothetical protein
MTSAEQFSGFDNLNLWIEQKNFTLKYSKLFYMKFLKSWNHGPGNCLVFAIGADAPNTAQ